MWTRGKYNAQPHLWDCPPNSYLLVFSVFHFWWLVIISTQWAKYQLPNPLRVYVFSFHSGVVYDDPQSGWYEKFPSIPSRQWNILGHDDGGGKSMTQWKYVLLRIYWGFPSGSVVKNLSANEGDIVCITDLGGSHMLQGKWGHVSQLLSLSVL